jgi:hypothetical protein
MATDLRLEQIAEGLAHLEAVFAEPGSLGDCSIADAAVSLASEFVGAYRDDEVTSRLAKLIDAETAGRPRDALRHLRFVRRKIDARWSVPRPESGGAAVMPDGLATAS